MHPGFIPWWHHRRHRSCGVWAEQGAGSYASPYAASEADAPDEARFSAEDSSGFPSGPFGVRRPLRFLAYKLGLSREQMAELATVLDELKTERAQAAVDHRRATSALADAVSGDAFDAAKVAEAGALRVESAERLKAAIAKALERVHGVLDEEQRKRFAYFLRTGVIAI